MKPFAYRGYFLPVTAVVAMLFLLALTLIRLAAVHDDLRNRDQANMTWVLSQTQLKSLQLQLAIQTLDDNPQAQQKLTDQLTLLLSRLLLLEDGPQRRFLESLNTQHQLSDHTATFFNLYQQTEHGPLDAPLLAGLTQQLDTLQHTLAALSQKAMFQQWELAGSQLDRYRNAVLTVIGLLVGILFCSLFISAKLLRTLKRAQAAHAIELHSLGLEARLISEQQANSLYRHFASMMSHQFRTPLAVMDASLQRILRTKTPLAQDELSQRITKARSAIARLTRVLDTLLVTDSPLNTEQTPSETHDLRTIVERSLSVQQFAMPNAIFTLSADSDAVVPARCDPGMTEQILLNLFSNAVKYGPPGQKIKLRVYASEHAACCSVTDEGGHVDTHEVPHLFERHFRGRHATGIKGSGLGLHIAQQLAQLQQGCIQLDLTPGKSTTFTLFLPLAGSQVPLIPRPQDDNHAS